MIEYKASHRQQISKQNSRGGKGFNQLSFSAMPMFPDYFWSSEDGYLR